MADILEYCEGLKIVPFKAGAVILTEGERLGKIYILAEGQVEVIRERTQVTHIDEPGSIFGEISVLLDIPHMASVRALTACRAHEVLDSRAFLQANQDIAYHLAKLLAGRLHGVSSYLVDLKRQFASHENHLGMVDDVLETLVHQQHRRFIPGSDRDPGY